MNKNKKEISKQKLAFAKSYVSVKNEEFKKFDSKYSKFDKKIGQITMLMLIVGIIMWLATVIDFGHHYSVVFVFIAGIDFAWLLFFIIRYFRFMFRGSKNEKE